MLEVSIKTPKEILFCKQTGLYIVYEVRISFKGPLNATLYVIVTSETNFMFFQTATRGCLHSDVSIEYVTAPVSLTESVIM